MNAQLPLQHAQALGDGLAPCPSRMRPAAAPPGPCALAHHPCRLGLPTEFLGDSNPPPSRLPSGF